MIVFKTGFCPRFKADVGNHTRLHQRETHTWGWILPFSVTRQCLTAEICSVAANNVTIPHNTPLQIIFLADITPYEILQVSPVLRFFWEKPDNVAHGYENLCVPTRMRCTGFMWNSRGCLLRRAYFSLQRHYKVRSKTVRDRVTTITNESSRTMTAQHFR